MKTAAGQFHDYSFNPLQESGEVKSVDTLFKLL